jgi:hypothetical protein
MKRIIWHWTAGTHKASKTDREHYHFIIEGDGTVVPGNKPPEANLSTKDGDYAAHTKGCNTGAIGIAVAAMRGAVERPFSAGPSPITPAQMKALVDLTAKLSRQYGIPVTPETILSHAEVQDTLGIAQRGKWDITWLPGAAAPARARVIGAQLRGSVLIASKPVDTSHPAVQSHETQEATGVVSQEPGQTVHKAPTVLRNDGKTQHKGWMAMLIRALFALFAKKDKKS